MSFLATAPFIHITDSNGNPLDNGYIYFGVENKNPETNPISIYWDDALSIPAANPVRTINGYISRSGTPANIYTSSNYSITAKDSNGRLVYNSPSSSGVIGPNAVVTQRGFFTGAVGGANIWRFADRQLVGEAAVKWGATAAGVPDSGTSWLSSDTTGPAFLGVHAHLLSTTFEDSKSSARYAIVGAAKTSALTGNSGIGVAGAILNTGTSTAGWGLYSDITRGTNAGVTYGVEFACKNQGTDVTGNSYSLSGGVIGVHLQGGGDSSYGGAATSHSTCAINISRGSTAIGAWNMGIRFSNNSITGTDGTTGTGIAITMAKGHTIEWGVNSTTKGAAIRSDVSALSSDVSIIFQNKAIAMLGTGEATTISTFSDVASAVNYMNVSNSATGGYPFFQALGTDANVGIFYQTKGTAPHRFTTNGSNGNEQFRVSNANSAVNYVNVTGSATGNPPVVSVGGTDTNIDLTLTPKGTGLLRYQVASAAAAIPANFTADRYIAFKDSSGTTYYLPCRATTW